MLAKVSITVVVTQRRREQPDARELIYALDVLGQVFQESELEKVPFVAEVLVLHQFVWT